MLAAGAFATVEDAQASLCLEHRIVKPQPASVAVYEKLYRLYHAIYFALGYRSAPAVALGDVLPTLREIAAEVNARPQSEFAQQGAVCQ